MSSEMEEIDNFLSTLHPSILDTNLNVIQMVVKILTAPKRGKKIQELEEQLKQVEHILGKLVEDSYQGLLGSIQSYSHVLSKVQENRIQVDRSHAQIEKIQRRFLTETEKQNCADALDRRELEILHAQSLEMLSQLTTDTYVRINVVSSEKNAWTRTTEYIHDKQDTSTTIPIVHFAWRMFAIVQDLFENIQAVPILKDEINELVQTTLDSFLSRMKGKIESIVAGQEASNLVLPSSDDISLSNLGAFQFFRLANICHSIVWFRERLESLGKETDKKGKRLSITYSLLKHIKWDEAEFVNQFHDALQTLIDSSLVGLRHEVQEYRTSFVGKAQTYLDA